MLIFQGLAGKGRAGAQKRRETQPNPTPQGGRPLEVPPEGPSAAGPLLMKEEWEFRASARNPKRNKVGRMPA